MRLPWVFMTELLSLCLLLILLIPVAFPPI